MNENKMDMMEGLRMFNYRRAFTIKAEKDDLYEEVITIHRKEGLSFLGSVFIEEKCKPDFSDIRLTTEDGKILSYEMYTGGPDVAYLKAKFPMKVGENTFYLYYGAKEAE